MQTSTVQMDLAEQFDHLSRAPIVEAVIDLRAPASNKWITESVAEELGRALPDYPERQNQEEVQHELKLHRGATPEFVATSKSLGVRFQTQRKDFIAQFRQTGFTLSHLTPYTSWERFISEGFRLWGIHCALTNPDIIQRIGVRFINRIPLPPQASLSAYLSMPPASPPSLPFHLASFIHKEQFAVPGYPYVVSLGRTIQPGGSNDLNALIIDIDVISSAPVEVSRREHLERCLLEMRWVKNKVFFASITQNVVNSFK